MYPAEINTQIAQQHIADLHAAAREARLAASARPPRHGFLEVLQTRIASRRTPTVAARTACSQAN